ncbi:hypothetical protein KAR91_48870 [Candidatus Pacearchaeota archaeon]|nr:hypothetical protein [Candidatus Pacearchaeota archaeon]
MKLLLLLFLILTLCSQPIAPVYQSPLLGVWVDNNNDYHPRYTLIEDYTFTCTHNGKSVVQNAVWDATQDTFYMSYACYYNDWEPVTGQYQYSCRNDTLEFFFNDGGSEIFIKE